MVNLIEEPQTKVLEFTEAPPFLESLREQGKRIVQCHGTFDLVHPGHIYHLEEAKSLGDVLVVTITGESHVNKGPGRPYFNDHLRSKALTALECVDYVVVIPYKAAVEAIECVRPHIYCKGKEYEDPSGDPTGNINDDVVAVERCGGEVRYIGSVVYSSTKLLNRHFDTFAGNGAKQYCEHLASEWSADNIREIIEGLAALKVLVVGDIIFDRYSNVRVMGLTSKNRTISSRHLEVDTQAGGALAVLRHIREFAPQVKLVSLAGTESWADAALDQYLQGSQDRVVRSPDFTTVVKHRFVEIHEDGKELSKLFSVNYLDDDPPSQTLQEKLIETLQAEMEWADLVMVMDFGHGVMQSRVRELVQNEAPFLALNCQTNSYNHGFNIINRQYQRADSFSLDQSEITLAFAQRAMDFEMALNELKANFGASYAWLTRGEHETIGLGPEGRSSHSPPLAQVVTDTVGAGDAFCSLASLTAAQGLPIEVGTYLGQVAGALAVNIVGNRDCVEKGALVKSAMSMLSF